MKILKSGKSKKPKETVTDCYCGCRFSFSKKEARFVSDFRDGDCYVAKCPECKRENWIAVELVH